MASASKRQDDRNSDPDAGKTPVPPYPAEVAGTWQAFRVTLRDTDPDDTDDETLSAADPQAEGPADDVGPG
jgi:hypothetical protein